MISLILLVLAVVFAIAVACMSFFTVEQQTVRFVESFGKFERIALPGLNFKVPFIESVSSAFDMRVQQIQIDTETKTEDNVFVTVRIAVQYEPLQERVKEAYYRLQNPKQQMGSYVFDVVRSKVPALTLDAVFLQKDDIATAVKEELAEVMTEYGYTIVKALVVDIAPAEAVVAAMNQVNASLRLREVATNNAESAKITVVKAAEAEAESKALQGKGIADERKAIIEGLKESVENMAAGVGVDPKEVMALVLTTQYFDTLKEIGKTSNTIMLPSSPAGMEGTMAEIRNAVLAAQSV